MKKTFIVVLLAFSSLFSFASFADATPAAVLFGKFYNKTPFYWNAKIQFFSYNQNIDIGTSYNNNLKQGLFSVVMPIGITAKLYLIYNVDGAPKPEKQCQFNLISTQDGDVSITEVDMPNHFVSCHLSGGTTEDDRVSVTMTSRIQKNHMTR